MTGRPDGGHGAGREREVVAAEDTAGDDRTEVAAAVTEFLHDRTPEETGASEEAERREAT